MLKIKITVCTIFLVLTTLACGFTNTVDANVQTTITDPLSGTGINLGEPVEIISFSSAEEGLQRVVLKINGQEVSTEYPPSGNPTQLTVIQSWTPIITGEVVASVVAYDINGESSDEATLKLIVAEPVADNSEIDDTSSTETDAGVLVPTETDTPFPTDTPMPTETSSPTPTPSPTIEVETECTLDSGFISDVTIPDNTEISPNTAFQKTWRLNNDGTCAWTSGTVLLFVSGDQMGGESSVAVPSINPGETVDLSVNLTSPSTPGTYKGSWRLHTNEGIAFGTTPHVQIIIPEEDSDDDLVLIPDPGLIFPGFVLAPTMDTVYEQTNIPAGEVGYVTASCPEETMVVSGGFAASSDLYVYNQSKQGNGWRAFAKNNSASSKLLNSYANCLRYSKGSTTQVFAQVTASGGGVGHPVVTCPSGSIVTGGGWASQSDGSYHIYNSSKSGNGWQIYAINQSGDNKLINAYAICLVDTSFVTEQLYVQESIPANSSDGAISSCAGIGLAVGGGFAGNSNLYIYNSSATSGTTDQWSVYARNSSSTSNLLNSYAICLSSP